jgi:tRNA nucleotidyltransferase (CCA-adding enzyme)
MPDDRHGSAGVAHWELFSHDADIGVRGVGVSVSQAFEQAALAVTAVVCDPASVVPRQPVPITCAGDDREVLFVDWLNAVVYEMATRDLLFGRFEVTIEDGRLQGVAWGEPVEVERHRPAVEVKGATYTALNVQRDEQGRWIAQCVVDV